MNRELLRPWGGTGGRPREAALGTDTRLHRVEVSWVLHNGVREWRATCGYRTGPTRERRDLMRPGVWLSLSHRLWRASLLDPTDASPRDVCTGCYPMLAGAS
jgi:hypothetical protein